jgi:hypothetical protein
MIARAAAGEPKFWIEVRGAHSCEDRARIGHSIWNGAGKNKNEKVSQPPERTTRKGEAGSRAQTEHSSVFGEWKLVNGRLSPVFPSPVFPVSYLSTRGVFRRAALSNYGPGISGRVYFHLRILWVPFGYFQKRLQFALPGWWGLQNTSIDIG